MLDEQREIPKKKWSQRLQLNLAASKMLSRMLMVHGWPEVITVRILLITWETGALLNYEHYHQRGNDSICEGTLFQDTSKAAAGTWKLLLCWLGQKRRGWTLLELLSPIFFPESSYPHLQVPVPLKWMPLKRMTQILLGLTSQLAHISHHQWRQDTVESGC